MVGFRYMLRHQHKSVIIIIVLIVGGLLAAILAIGIRTPPPDTIPVDSTTIDQERAWYRYFYSYYGSMMRYEQYGYVDARSNVYAKAIHDFVPIEHITEKVICPAQSADLVILAEKWGIFLDTL